MSTESNSDTLVLRELQHDDDSKGFLELLGQLTVVGDISAEQFSDRFKEVHESPDYKIVVIEDTSCSKIIGCATLLVERKFIRGCGKCGHIEDVVVDSTYRGRHLGVRLINALCDAAKELGCYKVILDCSEANQSFYAKCGLIRKEVQMVKYFNS